MPLGRGSKNVLRGPGSIVGVDFDGSVFHGFIRRP
jgi:hypothetical protein